MNNKIYAFIVPTSPKIAMYKVCGEYNGYVAIPPDHIAYGKSYDDTVFDNIKVHGGLTYSDFAVYKELPDSKLLREEYIGKRNLLFDKGKILMPFREEDNDYMIIDFKYLKDNPITDDYFIIGFDTCHLGDNPIIWNRTRVVIETLYLKKQIEEL